MTETQAADGAAWRAFMSEPAAYVDPSRLAGALGGEVGGELAARLSACGRLSGRLSALVARRAALPEPIGEDGLAAEDRIIAVASREGLQRIVLRAGAILWSGSVANAVRGRDVAAIEAAIGADVRGFAIAHRAAGGLDGALEPFDTLRERIMADGWRCYAGWCDAMPAAIGLRARLKMPAAADDAAGTKIHSEVGPAVMRLAAV